ncbi:MAG: hypothetical protein KAT15_02010, partial [Bacteroidales bacterium]|nr:hypothetical protein [Bacteroidales bacterium]
VCDDAGAYELRGSNLDNIPGDFQLVEAGQSVPIPGHIVDGNLFDNLADFNPVGLSGAYDVLYNYSVESLTVTSTLRLLINDLGSLRIDGIPDLVCKNDGQHLLMPDLLEFDPAAVYMISGPGVTGNQADGFYFDPSSDAVPVGENKIQLDYTSSNGCIAKFDTVVINNFVPSVDFIFSPVCLPPEGGTVEFTNMTSGKYSVSSWSWNFGDPESGAENISDVEHPGHFYSEPGWNRIKLTATTHEGCVAAHQVDTVFSDQPVADFTWLHNCYVRGERTEFVDRSITSFAPIDTFIWTFKTATGGVLGVIGTGSSEDTVRFPFTSMDSYVVELQIQNEGECGDLVTREVVLKPTIGITQDGYLEDFNSNKTDWTVGSQDQLSSWVLGSPDFTGFEQVAGDQAWYTSLPSEDTSYLEHSWIESPCFDFGSAQRPLIQMDL